MAEKLLMNKINPQIEVLKPWGKEIWFARTDYYMGKILIINPGEQVSLHRHDEKEETMYIWDGVIEVTGDIQGTISKIMGSGSTLHVCPGFKHSMKCISTHPAILFEASTPHPEDSVRIKDYYNRD